MSLLSGLITELDKVPAPRLAVIENVARMTAPAAHLEQRQQPGRERTPECKKRPTVAGPPRTSMPPPSQLSQSEQDTGQPQHFVQSAVTASPEWRHARDQYINHLMTCRGCYAPASRYCLTGAELRTTYENTPTEIHR